MSNKLSNQNKQITTKNNDLLHKVQMIQKAYLILKNDILNKDRLIEDKLLIKKQLLKKNNILETNLQ